MSRRGRSGPSISLFAFQDIITSVTAIVIVVVLFLALDLVQRKEAAHADTTAGVVEDLTARIEELKSELAQLQDQTARTDSTVRDSAKFSPAELQADVKNAEQAILDLQSRQKQLAERNKLWQSREKAALAQKFDLRPQQLQLEQTDKANRDLEQQIEAGRNDKRPIYGLPRGVTNGGWVAVIEKDVVTVAPLGRQARPQRFQQAALSLFADTSAGEFVKWVKQENHQNAYFLRLIRPGGATQFDEVDSQFAKSEISFGFDLIDAHQEILHPEKGAAP